MKNKMSTITIMLVIIITWYILFVFDFTLKIERGSRNVKIEYHGLIWVGLDYYSIWKYKSDDRPIKWLSINEI